VARTKGTPLRDSGRAVGRDLVNDDDLIDMLTRVREALSSRNDFS
jgi:hypothetical protein